MKQMPPLEPVKGTLEILRLPYNSLDSVPWNYFRGFSRLREVDLTSNDICTLPVFDEVAETLAVIAIGKNKLSTVELSSMNVSFPRLYRLNVGRNKITAFSWEILRHCPWLYFFYISENLLETMDDLSVLMHGIKTSVSL